MSRRIVRISIDGLIAAGKSTLLAGVEQRLRTRLAKHCALVVALEPIEQWQALDGKHDVLAYFYEAPEGGRAANFQNFAMTTRLRATNDAIESSASADATLVVLSERSVESDRYVFVRLLAAEHKMSPLEVAAYEHDWDYWVERAAGGALDALVLVDVDVATALERARERARDAESSLDADYLSKLALAYRRALDAPPLSALPQLQLRNVALDDASLERTADSLAHFIINDVLTR